MSSNKDITNMAMVITPENVRTENKLGGLGKIRTTNYLEGLERLFLVKTQK